MLQYDDHNSDSTVLKGSEIRYLEGFQRRRDLNIHPLIHASRIHISIHD